MLTGDNLYLISKGDEKVYQYNGTPHSWTVIGQSAESLAVAGNSLYLISKGDAKVYQYNNKPNSWTVIGQAAATNEVDPVKEQLSDIESMMTERTCACGKKQEVLAGFEAFIRAFPDAAITPRVKARLKSLQSEKSDMAYECQSG